MHDLFVRDVAASEDDLIHGRLKAKLFEPALILNRDATRIQPAGQFRRVTSPCNPQYLRGGEGNDPHPIVIAVDNIEVGENPARPRRGSERAAARRSGLQTQ